MKKDLADLETWAKVTATLPMNTLRVKLEAAWVNQEEKYTYIVHVISDGQTDILLLNSLL